MRRVAALYDIHGNLPALDAVLRDVSAAAADAVVVGGDLVPGPMPAACLDRLRRLDVPVYWLHGNGEHDALEAADGGPLTRVPAPFRDVVRWSAAALDEALHADVATWPDTLTLPVDGLGQVLFCHATPADDNDIFTRDTSADVLLPIFDAVHAGTVVCGHTHMPFERHVGRVRVINAGSVGMPFGDPRPTWTLIGSAVEVRRVDYDRDAAATAILASSYPQAAPFVDAYVRSVPAEAAMLEAFARVELASRRPRT